MIKINFCFYVTVIDKREYIRRHIDSPLVKIGNIYHFVILIIIFVKIENVVSKSLLQYDSRTLKLLCQIL